VRLGPGADGGFVLSIVLKFLPLWMDLSSLSSTGFAVANAEGVYEIPFLDRMGFVFIICVVGMILISLAVPNKARTADGPKGLEVDASMFRTSTSFTIIALLIIGILVALYTAFW